MPREQELVYQQVLHLIRQYRMTEAGDTVVVGVSGGIDSVVLVHVLAQLRNRLGITLHIAHLNHQFRGKEAARDAEFVRHLAGKLEIPCHIASRDVPELIRKKKLSPQDAARQIRYQFFESLARELNAQKIATAHNADDQAETVLLGIIRGVGIHGLGGIQPILKGKIIRPLLTTTRDQIETFAQAHGMEYVFDSSNTSRKYLRNAIRLDLLPLLKRQFNPAIIKRLTTYAQLFQEDAFFIDKIARERYSQICQDIHGKIHFRLDLFIREDPTIQRALVYQAFEALTGSRYSLETAHARAVIELFTHTTPGKEICLPGKALARRSYEWGYIQQGTQSPNCLSLPTGCISIPGKTLFEDRWIETEVFDTSTPNLYVGRVADDPDLVIQHFDYDQVDSSLTVRSRRVGDSFHPLGLHGKKTLKKFFIDRKVPRNKRNSIPIFVDKCGIIWIVGYSIDDRVKITKNTKRILTCRVYKHSKSENDR